MCCYYMYRTVKLKLSIREWHNVLRYEEGEYREFIKWIHPPFQWTKTPVPKLIDGQENIHFQDILSNNLIT